MDLQEILKPLEGGKIISTGMSKGHPVILVEVSKKKNKRKYVCYFLKGETGDEPGFPKVEELKFS